MHIGGLKETLKIGGLDNPVIKDGFDRILIPGSSLKGKIRSLLEKKEGMYNVKITFFKKDNKKDKKESRIIEISPEYSKKENKIKIIVKEINKDNKNENKKEKKENEKILEKVEIDGNVVIGDLINKYLVLKNDEIDYKIEGIPCSCGACNICKLFGPHHSKFVLEPIRARIRDSYLIIEKDDEEKILDPKDEEYSKFLELKPENIIDRIKGTAQHPRHTERVVAGSKFKFEVVFDIYKKEDRELIKKFIEGMKLLEDDYLGGSGSRGYGKVEFKNMEIIVKPKEYYERKGEIKEIKEISSLDELENKVDEAFNHFNFS
ncbi:type III-A CRISPR-associated RAMP protein Csm3 [Methanocaldococcus infernus]